MECGSEDDPYVSVELSANTQDGDARFQFDTARLICSRGMGYYISHHNTFFCYGMWTLGTENDPAELKVSFTEKGWIGNLKAGSAYGNVDVELPCAVKTVEQSN